jgi:8-oxo-dGTP pyrophosphatase MutT (NUDIX family)
MVIHVCIFNSKGEMLIQKRADDIVRWPSYWDVSVGGGAGAGDTSRMAAERETAEELGLHIDFSDRRPVITVNFADGFDDFWAAYPKPVAKQAAGKAWAKLKPDEELRKTILANISLRLDGEWKDIEPRYIPNPATYLNQRRWEDEQVKTGQKVTERVYKDADYENDW